MFNEAEDIKLILISICIICVKGVQFNFKVRIVIRCISNSSLNLIRYISNSRNWKRKRRNPATNPSNSVNRWTNREPNPNSATARALYNIKNHQPCESTASAISPINSIRINFEKDKLRTSDATCYSSSPPVQTRKVPSKSTITDGKTRNKLVKYLASLQMRIGQQPVELGEKSGIQIKP